jgi:hypothetical protein
MQTDPNRRFQAALERAQTEWAVADPQIAAALTGCTRTSEGVLVPFFGSQHTVIHPKGEALRPDSRAAHPSVSIVLLHHLLHADGTRPAEQWIAFRELPDGLFYSQAFAGHAEAELAARFRQDMDGFRTACGTLGGRPLDLADAAYRFEALPRLPVAVLVWAGDDEFPGQTRILFDANAGRQLPTEDLSGIGEWLAHRLVRQAGKPPAESA